MRTLHLFAGAGGGLLADRILGHTPIAAVEWDPYCCEVLRERSAAGWFPGLRVHETDIRDFNPSEYAGRVDIIHAGFPCQPFSVAGSRKGTEDERELFGEVYRCIRAIRPQYVFLENVPGLLSSKTRECVCGWPYRRGGLYSHTEAIRQANLHASCDSHDGEQGAPCAEDADVRIWREILRADIQTAGVGGPMDVAYQWGRSMSLYQKNSTVSGTEKSAGKVGARFGGFSRQTPQAPERDQDLDGFGSAESGTDETADAPAEQEGAKCPECGSGLVLRDGRPVWYAESVLGALAEMGFNAKWAVISAADAGAPHLRDRIWILADAGSGRLDRSGARESEQPGRTEAVGSGEDVADTNEIRRHGRTWIIWQIGREESTDDSQRLPQPRLGRMADGLANLLVAPDWWLEEPEGIPRIAQNIPHRQHRLKAIGNGQVPLTAALAWRILSA